MPARLPPLNALRMLEAAGRLESFTRAAEELNVTPGAVSRQIRLLEEGLGFPLFDRHHREVRLSAQGRAYVEQLSDSFRQIERATQRLVDQHRAPALHVRIAITFTLRWLVQRLAAFHARHPRQELRLSTALPSTAELAASTDVCLQVRTPEAVAEASHLLCAHRLFDIELVPVCSPSLLAAGALDAGPDALRNHALLHSNARPDDWADWLRAAGVREVDARSGIIFESSSLAYQAAIEGVGVAIGMRRLVEADLASGRLVMPCSFVHRADVVFYLLYARAVAEFPPVAAFRDWILETAGA